jgi:hypothetical protein
VQEQYDINAGKVSYSLVFGCGKIETLSANDLSFKRTAWKEKVFIIPELGIVCP